MKSTLLFKLEKAIFRFAGDIKWHGILHPFWFTINAKTFQLKGSHYREVEQLIQPGDIIVRRFEGYADKWLIPGWFNHAGIYVGGLNNKSHTIIHAISDGVVTDDLIDFMRTDHVVLLRPPHSIIDEAIGKAKKAIGSEYDFAFEFKDNLRFSCTELVHHCYEGIINSGTRFGRFTVIPDDILESKELSVIWDSRKIS